MDSGTLHRWVLMAGHSLRATRSVCLVVRRFSTSRHRPTVGARKSSALGRTEMAKATTYANDILDLTLPNAGSGTAVIGATTYTMPFRLLFLSTLSVAATQGTEWSTG